MITSIADLQALPNWVVFDQEPQPDGTKPKKIPYTPGTTTKARANDSSTWRTYAEACADAKRTGRHPGIALMPAMNLTLVDIDDRPESDAIGALNSYTERSINGGLHILVRGRPPAGFVAPAGIEVYPRDGNRFVLLTEASIDGRDSIADRTEVLARLFPAPGKPTQIVRTYGQSLDADDQTILERVLRMPKGRQLHGAGDTTGYPSASEADLALLNCYVKAGVTCPDRLEALYDQAALANPHWQHADYRTRTIAKALDGTVIPFEGWQRPAVEIVADPCADRVAALERQLAAAHATIAAQAETIATLRSVQSSSARIVGNRSLGPPRIIAAMLATQFAWRATAATPPGEVDAPPPPGMMRLGVAAGARLAGVSPKSAGTHFATLAEQGIIRRKIETRLVSTDPDTGEILPMPEFRSVHFVGPANADALTPQAAVTFAAEVADFTTERIENRGGKRVPRCPDHPEAGVLRETIDRCAECRRELDRDEAPLPAVALESLTGERSANFADHTRTVALVSMRRKSSDRSEAPNERRANFADQSRRDRAAADLALREPAYLADAPDPWDVPQPALFVIPDPPRPSVHFDVGD